MSTKPDLKTHVFICTRCKYVSDDGVEQTDFCPSEFRKTIKQMAMEKWDKQTLRVNESGCLGQCSRGVNAVCYPQSKWLHKLQKGDEKKVIDFIEKVLQD